MVNSSQFASDPWIDKPWRSTLREKLPRSVCLRYVNWGSKERQQVVTVTVKLEDEDREGKMARHRIRNQKRAERRQRLLNRLQEDVGESHDHSNNDLRNVINIGRDARSLIICRQQEQEGIESYNPTSNYRIPEDYSRPPRKRWHVNVDSRTSRDQRRAKAASAEERFNNLLDSKCRCQPKGNHSVFKCKALRKALGAPLTPNASPRV